MNNNLLLIYFNKPSTLSLWIPEHYRKYKTKQKHTRVWGCRSTGRVVFQHARSPEFGPQHCKNRSFLSAVNCISILGLLLLSCSCSLLFVGDRVLRCSPGRTWTHGVTKAHFKLTTVLSHSPRGWYWRLQLADLAASHRLAHTLKFSNSDFCTVI